LKTAAATPVGVDNLDNCAAVLIADPAEGRELGVFLNLLRPGNLSKFGPVARTVAPGLYVFDVILEVGVGLTALVGEGNCGLGV
jgi:hypothetical protein